MAPAPPLQPSRLFRKVFLGYAVLVTLALTVCVLLISREFDSFHIEELTRHLTAQAHVLQIQARGHLNAEHREQIDKLAKEAGPDGVEGGRITFVAADGTVLGDSMTDAMNMGSYADREEIHSALTTGWGTSTRWSNTLSRHMKYVAVRVGPADEPEGVVRVALSIETIGSRGKPMRRVAWTIAIIALLASIAFGLGLARLWTHPIRAITLIADRLSRGDFTARAEIEGSDELAVLGQSLNAMRDHLARQIDTIDRNRRTLQALLDQLQEGVVVAGADGKIVLANPAAVALLEPDIPPDKCRDMAESWLGRTVETCVHHHDLQRLLLPSDQTSAPAPPAPAEPETGAPTNGDDQTAREVRLEFPTSDGRAVVLGSGADIILPGEGTSDQASTGRILALTDITEVAQTIQIKTDFVANASHELRTPLSAIRAAVDTLLGLNITANADDVRRFIGVIDRHSARLEALVADLLALSRLESPASESKPRTIDLHHYCDELHARWSLRLKEKQGVWSCHLPPPPCHVNLDPQLADMALDNVIENAIKFIPQNGHVSLTIERTDDGLAIKITDNGRGIPSDDQQRVFERFYQVASDRSGTGSPTHDMRGTGLGLAIVRHAVAAMDGVVMLDSTFGHGTTVLITLPQP